MYEVVLQPADMLLQRLIVSHQHLLNVTVTQCLLLQLRLTTDAKYTSISYGRPSVILQHIHVPNIVHTGNYICCD